MESIRRTNEHRNLTGTLLRNSLIAQLSLEPDLSENLLADSLKALSPDDILKYLTSLHPSFSEKSPFSSLSLSELQQTLYILYFLGDGRSFEPALIRQTALAAHKHLGLVEKANEADKPMKTLYRSGFILPEENGLETTSSEHTYRCRTVETIRQLTPYEGIDKKLYYRKGFGFLESLRLYGETNLRRARNIGTKHVKDLLMRDLILKDEVLATTAFEKSLDGLYTEIVIDPKTKLLRD